MRSVNLTVLWTWPLLVALVVAMMSFQDPLRIAVLALLVSVHGPMWRALHAWDRRTQVQLSRTRR